MIFACMPSFGGDERETLLLAHSLRAFGGVYRQSPLMLLEAAQAPLSPPLRRALTGLSAEVVPFSLPEACLSFPFAPKVFAAAEAEARVGSELLVWMDPDTLVLDEPEQFALPVDTTIGCCPVQLKNISAIAGQPPGPFWQAVYAGCGTPPERVFTVTTSMDQLEIHAHFNAGLLVVRPQAGLLAAWRGNFERLYLDTAFVPFYAEHQLYRIFMHQAVLSATLLAHLPRQAIHLFPGRYNAAIFLRQHFPLTVEQAVTCRYDELSYFDDPAWENGIRPISDRINRLLASLNLETGQSTA